MNERDKYYLQETIRLARKAEGKTSPNPLVGALIVKNDKIVGKGFHKYCGGPHAEIYALRQAKDKARRATLYVNLEPCVHFGRTPPCADEIIKAGIKKVVIGMKDPNPLNNGKGIRKLKRAGIITQLSPENKKIKELNRIFIKYITKKQPYIMIKVGQSLDGKIALANGSSKWITAELSRSFAQRLRNNADAIMVGINTVIKDDPLLSCRYKDRTNRMKPIKVILDAKLRISLKAKIFGRRSPAKVIIATTKLADRNKLNALRKKGVEIIICPLKEKKFVDLKFLLKVLAQKEISSILVEGGAALIGSCFDEKIADKIYFFIASKIIGGKDSLSSVTGKGVSSLKQTVKLDEIKINRIGEDILVEGNVRYSSSPFAKASGDK